MAKHSAESKQKRVLHPNSLANLRPRPDLLPKGRKPGQLNRDTRTLKLAIADFLQHNQHRLQAWLDRIEEEKGPVEAWRMFADLIEYKMPKLARTEHTGADGGPIQVVQVSFMGIQQSKAEPKPNQVETLSPLDVPMLSQDHRVETNLIETTQEEYANPTGSSKGEV